MLKFSGDLTPQTCNQKPTQKRKRLNPQIFYQIKCSEFKVATYFFFLQKLVIRREIRTLKYDINRFLKILFFIFN